MTSFAQRSPGDPGYDRGAAQEQSNYLCGILLGFRRGVRVALTGGSGQKEAGIKHIPEASSGTCMFW